jgi:hypothetical protein
MTSGTPRRNLLNWIWNVMATSSMRSFFKERLRLRSIQVVLHEQQRPAPADGNVH